MGDCAGQPFGQVLGHEQRLGGGPDGCRSCAGELGVSLPGLAPFRIPMFSLPGRRVRRTSVGLLCMHQRADGHRCAGDAWTRRLYALIVLGSAALHRVCRLRQAIEFPRNAGRLPSDTLHRAPALFWALE